MLHSCIYIYICVCVWGGGYITLGYTMMFYELQTSNEVMILQITNIYYFGDISSLYGYQERSRLRNQ
jgi:hypothetical protein